MTRRRSYSDFSIDHRSHGSPRHLLPLPPERRAEMPFVYHRGYLIASWLTPILLHLVGPFTDHRTAFLWGLMDERRGGSLGRQVVWLEALQRDR